MVVQLRQNDGEQIEPLPSPLNHLSGKLAMGVHKYRPLVRKKTARKWSETEKTHPFSVFGHAADAFTW